MIRCYLFVNLLLQRPVLAGKKSFVNVNFVGVPGMNAEK